MLVIVDPDRIPHIFVEVGQVEQILLVVGVVLLQEHIGERVILDAPEFIDKLSGLAPSPGQAGEQHIGQQVDDLLPVDQALLAYLLLGGGVVYCELD